MHYETEFFFDIGTKKPIPTCNVTICTDRSRWVRLFWSLHLIKTMTEDLWIRHYLIQEVRVNQNGFVNRLKFFFVA